MTKAEKFLPLNIKVLRKVILFLIFIVLSHNSFSIPFERTFRKDNQCAEYAAIADAYYEQKNYSKASEYYEKARKAPKFYDSMTYKLACSKALGGDFLYAKELFSELLAKESSNRTLKESLAYCTVMSGDLEAGINLYESLVMENPEDGNTWKNYIKVLIASEQKEKAEIQIEKYEKIFGKGTDTESLRKRLTKKENVEVENETKVSEKSENETIDKENTEKNTQEENKEKVQESSKEDIEEKIEDQSEKDESEDSEEAEDNSDSFIPDFTQGFDD